jgi:hypothetical protein
MFVNGSGQNMQSLERTAHRCFLQSFISSRFVNKHDRHRRLLFLIDWFFKFFSSETVRPNEPKLCRKHLWARFFRNQPIRNKHCLWWPCLLTDRDKMSNFYRGPSIDASYQVSVHLAKRFQRRRFFFKSANQKQEWPNESKLGRKHPWKVLYKDC